MNNAYDTAGPLEQADVQVDGHQLAIDTYVVLRRTVDTVSRHVEAELEEWGLTSPQYGVLLHLMKRGPLSMTDLSKLIFRSNSTLTPLIDQMEHDGLVVRTAHPTDRRIWEVGVTQKGKDVLREIRRHHRPFLAEMMSCLTQEELAQLRFLLEKIESRIADERG